MQEDIGWAGKRTANAAATKQYAYVKRLCEKNCFSHLNTLHNEGFGSFLWHFRVNFIRDVCSFKYLEGVLFEKRSFVEFRKCLAKNTFHGYLKRLCISSTLLRRVFLNANLIEFSSSIDLWPIV